MIVPKLHNPPFLQFDTEVPCRSHFTTKHKITNFSSSPMQSNFKTGADTAQHLQTYTTPSSILSPNIPRMIQQQQQHLNIQLQQ